MAGIIFAVLSIYFKRKFLNREAVLTTKLSLQITDFLVSSVVSAPANAFGRSVGRIDLDTGPFYKLGLSVKKVNQVFVQEMLNHRNNFSGRIAEQIRMLYLQLSLHKDALARVAFPQWETKVNAITELYKMDVELPRVQLLELVQDKNPFVREVARLSMIKFSKENPLEVLYGIKEPISQWEELEMYLLLQQRPDLDADSLQGLISIEREVSVASLALKLAIYYKHLSAIPAIIALIDTPDLKLRSEAVLALGKLEAKRAEKFLFEIYHDQPREIKLAIISAMGLIQSGDYLDFLSNEFLDSDDFGIKKYASDTIIKLYPLSKMTLEKLMITTETLNKSILNHSLDPLINAS